ncbi:SDR family oxidoreductase [Neorhizobium alkalisoli]|uniref:NAD(P)-dependent dehydrogenase (Short-subunit alcohol dehydrogenase family) n=1 Tax=Neorhizobium alkalisoli TaxID=528178 RepID=A0A561PZ92_9HYPH|nr:SDR family oxidoreductase [Neorhizobium alkalisoli]TWF43436.1 NAD(P)-dependent dehydrogenase (short-subunit alcohol dehydrogenase family) [Neorhizobium alkalisoli]
MAKIALVTGGSSGIGAATCRLLAQRGWSVAVHYRTGMDMAERLVAKIRQEGGRAVAVEADVSDRTDVLRMFETIDACLGPVSGLVNSAGIAGPRARFETLDPAGVEEVFRVNVIGTFLCSREAIRRMSTFHGGEGGAIVNLSSGLSNTGGALTPFALNCDENGRRSSQVAYAASKGAINSFTMALAQEIAADGIRVNAVSPGATFTGMADTDRMAAIADTIPIGRGADPSEIAEAIEWLLSDKASYVAGANLRVGGGRLG